MTMRFAVALALSLAAGACMTPVVPPVTVTEHLGPGVANTFVASEPTLVESYGQASPKQFGELRIPSGNGPFPVAVLIHGGCYVGMGSTRNMGLVADYLRANGVATWNVDYREIGSGGGWTATFEDWAAGLAALPELAERFPLDLSRVSLVGHSAGVTPAVWLTSGNQGERGKATEPRTHRHPPMLPHTFRTVVAAGCSSAQGAATFYRRPCAPFLSLSTR